MDERWHQLARVALSHSLQVQQGERVLIRFNAPGAAFATVVGQEVVLAGGHPVFSFRDSRVVTSLLAHGTPEQIGFVHPSELAQTGVDCQVLIEATHGAELPLYTHEALRLRVSATAEWARQIEQVRWVCIQIPTEALARNMAMTFKECADLHFRLIGDVDWAALARRAQAIQSLFAHGSEVRIEAPGTDITFSIAGRQGLVGEGIRNLPDGELHWAPVAGSANGYVTFPHTQVHGGPITQMFLRFQNGEVIAHTAEIGLDDLEAALATDDGARRLGEFGIGCNPIDMGMTLSPFINEKILGTVHLALGNCCVGSGGSNPSRLHWGVTLDLRQGGCVYVDDRLVCCCGTWMLDAKQLAHD